LLAAALFLVFRGQPFLLSPFRPSRLFGMWESFWTGLQMDYDAAKTKDSPAKTLADIKPWPHDGAHPGIST
jgi:hypothetical protein